MEWHIFSKCARQLSVPITYQPDPAARRSRSKRIQAVVAAATVVVVALKFSRPVRDFRTWQQHAIWHVADHHHHHQRRLALPIPPVERNDAQWIRCRTFKAIPHVSQMGGWVLYFP